MVRAATEIRALQKVANIVDLQSLSFLPLSNRAQCRADETASTAVFVAVHGVDPKHDICPIHRFVIEVLIEMDSVSLWSLPGAAIVKFVGMKCQYPQVGVGP